MGGEGAGSLVFYRGQDPRLAGVNTDGTSPQQRNKRLGVVEWHRYDPFRAAKASSARVTPNLVGVSESTGGRALTTIFNLLRGALRPLVRLQLLHKAEATRAPPNTFATRTFLWWRWS